MGNVTIIIGIRMIEAKETSRTEILGDVIIRKTTDRRGPEAVVVRVTGKVIKGWGGDFGLDRHFCEDEETESRREISEREQEEER